MSVREIIALLAAGFHYDPKDIAKAELPRRYRESLAYGVRHCPHLVKTGWTAINGNVPKPFERSSFSLPEAR